MLVIFVVHGARLADKDQANIMMLISASLTNSTASDMSILLMPPLLTGVIQTDYIHMRLIVLALIFLYTQPRPHGGAKLIHSGGK